MKASTRPSTQIRGALPGPDPAGAGRAADAIFRHRPCQPRQLPGDDQRPGGDARNPADCGVFADFVQTGTAPDGQAIGHGCVYPANVRTLADQLTKAGLGWRGYMEDMGNDPQREATSCGHAVIGEKDPTHRAEPPSATSPIGDQYAARHDPFVYFHSILDSPDCAKNVIRLDQLPSDLQAVASTPEFSFITPNLCHDGHDEPCKNGEHGGLESADGFLKHWVPIITAAPAFKLDGLLIITFDESDESSVAAKPEAGMSIPSTAPAAATSSPAQPRRFPAASELRRDEYVMASFGGDRSAPCCCRASSSPRQCPKSAITTIRC